MLPILLLVTTQTPPPVVAGRYEMGVRLKQLDQAWLAERNPVKRKAAVTHLQVAVTGFFSGQFSQACRSLDAATESLGGLQASPVTVRPHKWVISPGEPLEFAVSWTYLDLGDQVSLNLAGIKKTLTPGEAMKASFNSAMLPLVDGERRISLTINGQVHPEFRIAEIANFEDRLKKLESSQSPLALGLAGGIRSAMKPDFETTLPIARMLREAEALDAGSMKPSELNEVYAARIDGVSLRARIPKSAGIKPPVVVALHGAGGSENMFFDSLGAGLGPRLAEDRGWVYVSPRSAGNSVAASLKWLREVRGVEPGPLLVMGHSMGGGLAVQSGRSTPKAIALFAPAASMIPTELANTPIFLSVGDDELRMLQGSFQRLRTQLNAASTIKTYPNCEHLMIVADALPDAFTFFDKVLAEQK